MSRPVVLAQREGRMNGEDWQEGITSCGESMCNMKVKGRSKGKEKQKDPCLSDKIPLNKMNRMEECKRRQSGLRRDEEFT